MNESLSLCLTKQASPTLVEATRIRSDERLLLSIQHQDLIAIEVRYYRSCYLICTHKQNLERFIEARIESPVASYSDVNIMDTVLRETEVALFQDKRTLQLGFLRQHCLEIMEQSQSGVVATTEKSLYIVMIS